MNKKHLRLAAIPGVLAVAGAALGISAATASADNVTGGSITITFATNGFAKLNMQGIAQPFPAGTTTAGPGLVAPQTANSMLKGVAYQAAATGGNASVGQDYGFVQTAGALQLVDYRTQKSVTLTNLTFTVQDDTISAVPSDSPDGSSVVFFDTLGAHTFSNQQPENFTSDRLQFDPAGIDYLNQDLGSNLDDTSTAKIGSFSTSFTSTPS